ncbi:MAG: hypothetical protein M0R37_15100 [Bacteroidales bacterium]|jgi:hypothetical protein|nr:hypothetical protein [Bacteroidales bacterium]
MGLVEFLIEWHEYGFRVALYNVVWLRLHRNDDHAVVWNEDAPSDELLWTAGHLGDQITQITRILQERTAC